MTDPANDIDELIRFLQDGCDFGCECGSETAKRQYAALTALVAERNALKQRVAELEHLSKPVYITHGQRVESIDLRERLVCAALTGVMADSSNERYREHWAVIAVQQADAALAAMRKGATDA